jgi:acetoin utilization deacetylase AcuC-like enzyme
MDTAYVYHPIYLEHNLPSHPENARRLKSIISLLEDKHVLDRLKLVEPRLATEEDLERVHTPTYVDRVKRMAEGGGGHLDADTYVSPRSFEAALMAAGGGIRAVEAVLAGEVANGFALVRPPGHHAMAEQAMGFCLFNNVAIAARAALSRYDVERVLIADFDVHHGNGTEALFACDSDVFFFSTHQYPYYPGTGNWRETGEGPGAGTVLNVPLPAGVGDEGYLEVYTALVWPLAERFQPDLLLVSAGYDAHWKDPLAQMNLSLTGYGRLQRELVHMADDLCAGRIVFMLEGGYQLDVLSYGVLNAFYAMMGEEAILDPWGPSPQSQTEPSLQTLLGRLKEAHGLN